MCKKRCRRGNSAQRSVRLDEGLLRDIHCITRVADVPRHQFNDSILIFEYQEVKGLFVTLLYLLNKHLIGVAIAHQGCLPVSWLQHRSRQRRRQSEDQLVSSSITIKDWRRSISRFSRSGHARFRRCIDNGSPEHGMRVFGRLPTIITSTPVAHSGSASNNVT